MGEAGMIRASFFAVALLGAACTPPAAEDDAGAPAPDSTAAAPTTRETATAQDSCGAAQYHAMIGTPLAAASFPADPNIRIIQPDTVVTQDFRADRLNVIVDANGNITALECY
jgi:hypothetical protein